MNKTINTEWIEVHHEVVSFISDRLRVEDGDGVVKQMYELSGIGGMYILAEQWTDEFQEQFENTNWGESIEFFPTIENWLNAKDLNQTVGHLQYIKGKLEDAVNKLFGEAQDLLGATTGDIDPMQVVLLDELNNKLAGLILEVANQNVRKD